MRAVNGGSGSALDVRGARPWVRRTERRACIVTAALASVVGIMLISRFRHERWRHDLRRTGVETTAEVVKIGTHVTRSGGVAFVSLRVLLPRPSTTEVWPSDPSRYSLLVGHVIAVRQDPDHPTRVATEWHVSPDVDAGTMRHLAVGGVVPFLMVAVGWLGHQFLMLMVVRRGGVIQRVRDVRRVGGGRRWRTLVVFAAEPGTFRAWTSIRPEPRVGSSVFVSTLGPWRIMAGARSRPYLLHRTWNERQWPLFVQRLRGGRRTGQDDRTP